MDGLQEPGVLDSVRGARHPRRADDALVHAGAQGADARGGLAPSFRVDIPLRHTEKVLQAPQQIAEFESPDVQTLVDYQRAVLERSQRYFYTLSKTDLDRELDEPFQPLPTVGVRLISIMEDSILHAGQAAYVRGLHQGRGWQKY